MYAIRSYYAFAQFGSDLDKATKAQLERGHRIMEILKQAQYNPYPVEEQVVSFFMVTKGLLDDVAVDEIGSFEKQVLTELRTNTDILKQILDKKALDKELEAKLEAAIKEFKASYK